MDPSCLTVYEFYPAIGIAVRDFLVAHPKWIGRVMWWYEGQTESTGTAWIRVFHPGGSGEDSRGFTHNQAKIAMNWATDILTESCHYDPPPLETQWGFSEQLQGDSGTAPPKGA